MKRATRGNKFMAVAADAAVDLDHDLAVGLSGLWSVPPGMPIAGNTLYDLLRRNNAALTAGPQKNLKPLNGLGSLTYDGATQSGACGTAPADSGVYTVMATFATTDASAALHPIVAKDGAWFVITFNGQLLYGDSNAGNYYPGVGSGPSVIDGGYHVLAVTRNSSAANDSAVYLDGQFISLATMGTAGTGDIFYQGGTTSSFFPGTIADVAWWTRVLSPAEIRNYTRQVLAGFQVSNSLLRWVSTRTYGVAGGGTPNTQSNAGSITASGTLLKLVTKAFAGSSTGTGALAKAVAKPGLVGSITASGSDALYRTAAQSPTGSCTGSGSIAKAASKPLAGSATASGALVKAASKALAGSVTTTGAIAKAVVKALGGSITGIGSLVKAIAKTFGGSSTATGSLTAIGVKLQSVGGSIAGSGSLLKQGQKHPSGTSMATGGLTKAVAAAKAGSVPASGAVVKQVAKSPTGSVTGSGSVSNSRAAAKAFAGFVAGIGGLVKALAKQFVGFVTATGDLTASGGTVPPIATPPPRRFTVNFQARRQRGR